MVGAGWMIELDGSHGEGGGQMLRTALALSLLTQKAFSMHSIRAGRDNPGLRPQHLSCVRLCQQLCDAVVEGDEIGSMKVTFYPRAFKPRTLAYDIGTAGSVTLLAQSVLPALVFGPGKVRLRLTGGTDVRASPTADYFSNVLLPLLRSFADIEFTVLSRGFFPKGGGSIELFVRPKVPKAAQESFAAYLVRLRGALRGFELTFPPKPVLVRGISFASKELEASQVAQRQARSARLGLQTLLLTVKIDSMYAQTQSIGSAITLWVRLGESDVVPLSLGSSALGERGVAAEAVGSEAANRLLAQLQSGGCVDSHLGDQLVPFLAIVGGKIKLGALTDHLRSGVYVTRAFLGETLLLDEQEKVLSA